MSLMYILRFLTIKLSKNNLLFMSFLNSYTLLFRSRG